VIGDEDVSAGARDPTLRVEVLELRDTPAVTGERLIQEVGVAEFLDLTIAGILRWLDCLLGTEKAY
jgi:hypothetical protein